MKLCVNGQLNVNESLLTGRSDEDRKRKSEDELLSSSFCGVRSCLTRLTRLEEKSLTYQGIVRQQAKGNSQNDPFFKPSNFRR